MKPKQNLDVDGILSKILNQTAKQTAVSMAKITNALLTYEVVLQQIKITKSQFQD